MLKRYVLLKPFHSCLQRAGRRGFPRLPEFSPDLPLIRGQLRPAPLAFRRIAAVLVLLALDLGVFHRKAHSVSHREALGWTAVWISLALAFNGWIFARFGSEHGLEFLTGYVIEKSLSVDNVFVWAVIFSSFAIPARYQHRVLFWGIFGALVFRGIFIFAGVTLLERNLQTSKPDYAAYVARTSAFVPWFPRSEA